jgi:hypothetical protein
MAAFVASRLHPSVTFLGVAYFLACSSGDGTGGPGGDGADAGADTAARDGGLDGSASPSDAARPRDVGPNLDAFFADDPPPMYCGPDGGMGPPPEPPGGTPECPADKNREGCRCDSVGEEAPCWPGKRVNRNRGICRDGTTTCEPFDEFTGRWGPCRGFVLPEEGATVGPEACRCFSAGRWELENLNPCFIFSSSGDVTGAVSTYVNESGVAQCPEAMTPPMPRPGSVWSENRLTVDCEGRFRLCYTIKAGDFENPQPDDCSFARVCTEDWYAERGVTQELPPLPAWTGTNPSCAQEFVDSGGYGEMSVLGTSVECDPVDDGSGGEYVFNRIRYCPLCCGRGDCDDPSRCEGCQMGGSGDF